jgi:GT2 family glycosyltransferase
MDGLALSTSYPNVEWIVVDNESTCPETLNYFKTLKKMGARILAYPKPFNYAAINNFAAKKATGELILFLNNDTEMQDPAWLTEMVVQFQRPGVGVVGKKLLWPNRMVQHGGVVVGIHGLAAHAFGDCEAEDPGYFGFNLLDREQSAVTAACLMIRRADFLKIGGFDDASFPVAFNDVDLCLKMRQDGQRIVITTAYPLIHNESSSRGKEDSPQKRARARRERNNFTARWMPTDRVFHDPFYHPGLNRDYHFGPYSGFGMCSFSNTPITLSAHSEDNDQPLIIIP